MEFTITNAPRDEDIQDIRNGLIEHNSPFLAVINHTDVACYSYQDNGDKSGGIVGEIWGNWLLIKYLWVDKQFKGQGIGTDLLTKLEVYAFNNGCHSSLLDTFSFQAKPFYERHGYECQMTLNNYPISEQRHYLTKQLNRSSS